MITDQDWVLGISTFLIPMTIIYFFQKTRWGIRIMSQESMRQQMSKEISDRLWERMCEGKIDVYEAIKTSNFLGDLLELPELISLNRLKRLIRRRIRTLKQTGKPNIPGDKPLQDVIRTIWTPAKRKLSSISFKFTGK